jgi:hypothetical protein
MPDTEPGQLHRCLTLFNPWRLSPGFADGAWQDQLKDELALRILEGDFVEAERNRIAGMAAQAPEDADGFVAWFEDLRRCGPGQGDPLFPWLAERATLDQFRWFLTQEVAGEAGFDDLVALTQVKALPQAKLELARNYWDELGRGDERAMHGVMLDRLSAELCLSPSPASTVWEALALSNLMVALAANRRYTHHSLGALGVIELTAPDRVALVDHGLQRCGVSAHARRYFTVHATLDIRHSQAWNREVLHPIVAAEPRAARAIAEGALMRLEAGRRCFERYRQELARGQSTAEPQSRPWSTSGTVRATAHANGPSAHRSSPVTQANARSREQIAG